MTQEIVFKNFSTVVTDAEAVATVSALQKQCGDLRRAYGFDLQLGFVERHEKLTADQWLLAYFDTSDQAGALGYHDLTKAGAPIGKVFAKSTLRNGGLPSVTASHELIEMAADPLINICAIDESTNILYAYELCDAVEADALGYEIDGVRVSDFVLPNWFRPTAQTTPRSWCGNVTRAFELAPGGYISFFNLSDPLKGWQQKTLRTASAQRSDRNARRERLGRCEPRIASEAD